MSKKRVDFMKTAKAGADHQHRASSPRANRRWLEKMKKRHPAEYAEAMRRIDERYGK